MVHVEAVIPYGQGELVNLIHRLGIVELEVSETPPRNSVNGEVIHHGQFLVKDSKLESTMLKRP